MTADEFNELGVHAMGVEPAKKYNEDLDAEDRVQRRNAKDVPLWDVHCSTKHPGERTTNFTIRIASAVEPEISAGLIRFGGLRASTYPDGSRNIVTFAADTFTQEAAPSAKRGKTPPVPSAVEAA